MATSHTRARRVKGLIAGACVAALLLAGGTWALWYAESDVAGGWITAGNLEIVKADGAEVVYDISNLRGTNEGDKHTWTESQDGTEYRTDQTILIKDQLNCLATPYAKVEGHVANLQGNKDENKRAWKASPGDSLLSVWPYYVALEGDNLVAEVKIKATKALPEGELAGIVDAFSELKNVIYIQTESGAWEYITVFDSSVYSDADKADKIENYLKALGEGAFQSTVLLEAPNEDAGTEDLEDAAGHKIHEIGLTSVPDANSRPAKTANACVVFEGTFAPNTTEQDLVTKKLLTFPDLMITLEQTRADTVGNFQ